jgi:hypothetical protein
MSGRIRKSNRYIKRAMCQAAWAASHTKNTYLSAFYRRMAIRKGAPKAVIALAHHMILIVHRALSRKAEYVEFGGDYYDRRDRPRTAARLVSRLQKLGYRVEVHEEPFPEELAEGLPPEASGDSASREAIPPVPVKRNRGRPCKCAERGIMCRHHAAQMPNSLREQPSSPDQFS